MATQFVGYAPPSEGPTVYKSRPTVLVGASSPDRGLGHPQEKDFGQAYRKQSQAKAVNGHYISKKEALDVQKFSLPSRREQQEEHRRREELFLELKNDRVAQLGEDQDAREMAECNFHPQTYASKRAGDDQPRDLYDFLSDQQRFLENTNLKALKIKQDTVDQEISEIREPHIDPVSQQIVELMKDRNAVPTAERLYKHGAERQRKKLIDEKLKNQEAEMHAMRVKIPKAAGQQASPVRESHRGTDTGLALNELHEQIENKKEEMRHQQRQSDLQKNNTLFKNRESDTMIIQAFRKEFRQQLPQDNTLDAGAWTNPKNHVLEFDDLVSIMHNMGFLSSKASQEQEQQIDDLYCLFKCRQDQKILAENLQNVLLVISGQRDANFEVENDLQSKNWQKAGLYDEDTGLFYLRHGEHTSLQQHFKYLKVNRLQQKKAANSFAYKKANPEPTYKPTISKKSQQMAEARRKKLFENAEQVDVVNILLHPNNVQGDVNRMQRIHDEKMAREYSELTLQPETNASGPRQAGPRVDRNIALYQRSKVHEKRNRTSEEIEYEKNAHELKFAPTINAGVPKGGKMLSQVKGTAAAAKRHAVARQQATLAQKMTERSPYSAEAARQGPTGKLARREASPARASPPREQSPTGSPQRGSPGREYSIEREQNGPSPPRRAADEAADPKDLVDEQLSKIQDRLDERDPKLYVDVNIGKSGVERIVVYEGDTADSLATEFCLKHNLKPEMREKLVILLEQQIAGVLPKIEEGEDGDDSEEDSRRR